MYALFVLSQRSKPKVIEEPVVHIDGHAIVAQGGLVLAWIARERDS